MVLKYIVLDMDHVLLCPFIPIAQNLTFDDIFSLNELNQEDYPLININSIQYFWFNKGILNLVEKIKERNSDIKFILWTSRNAISANLIFPFIPDGVFENKYSHEQDTHNGTTKNLKKFVEKYYPSENVSEFLLVDDANENFILNKPNCFHYDPFFAYTEKSGLLPTKIFTNILEKHLDSQRIVLQSLYKKIVHMLN